MAERILISDASSYGWVPHSGRLMGLLGSVLL
jgi:hypothetical protein